MIRLSSLKNLPLTTLIKEEYKNIKDSKHSPVYRKSGVEGFAPLFSLFSIHLGKAESKIMHYLKILILFCGISIVTTTVNSQTIKPVIDLAFVDPDNPFVAHDTALIIVHVKILSGTTNNDTGFFYGNLKYNLQSDKMGAVNENWKLHLDDDPTYEEMLPGGKIDTMFVPVDTAAFRTTGTTPPLNVIIIWPAFINPALPMVDSGEVILWDVPGYIGIYEESVQKFGSTVFPNPSDGIQLVFVNSKYTKDIKSISIMNSLGQIMNVKEFDEGENSKGYVLPTEALQSGIYHIHIVYQDNKREVVKFIKN